MITKELSDVMKSLPSSNDVETGVVVKDSNGKQYSKPIAEFGCVKKMGMSVGQVLRIGNIGSVLISARGYNSGRCALIWVSSYNDGTYTRTTARRIHNSDTHYEWYVNGASDASACVYVKCLLSTGFDNISVLSLFGELPKVGIVSAVPSDATPLVFANS